LSFALISVDYEMRKKLVYPVGIKDLYMYGNCTNILRKTKMAKRTIKLLGNILSKYHMYRNKLRLRMYIVLERKKIVQDKDLTKNDF
jgi:hypothetical protein